MRPAEPRPTRRRLLRIAAATAGLGAIGGTLSLVRSARAGAFYEWQGEALGAFATMQLWDADRGHARRTMRLVERELAHLEQIFSLFEPTSELVRLNTTGVLERPSQELRQVLETSQRVGDASRGAFDVTVQPLWEAHSRHFAARPDDPAGPPAETLAAARRLVDYRAMSVGATRVELARPGMAVTLNGIAQGFVTDRVTSLLRNEGFDHAMVDTGEIRALGTHPEGRAWQVGLRDAEGRAGPDRTIALADAAVAISGTYGHRFEPSGRHHHLFDPGTGGSVGAQRECVVLAPTAMVADALATAICIGGTEIAPTLLAAFPGAELVSPTQPTTLG